MKNLGFVLLLLLFSGCHDEEALLRVAIEDEDSFVRASAVRKITDQQALARILVGEKKEHVCVDIIRALTDQEVLKNVALQEHLKKLALESEGLEVRKAAINKINDEQFLSRMASESDDIWVRYEAINNVFDKELLARDYPGNVAKFAMLRLSSMDPVVKKYTGTLWISISGTGITQTYIGAMHISGEQFSVTVTQPSLIVLYPRTFRSSFPSRVIQYHSISFIDAFFDVEKICKSILIKKGVTESGLADIVLHGVHRPFRQAAIRLMKDQELLLLIALGDYPDHFRRAAAVSLTDEGMLGSSKVQDYLFTIAIKDPDWDNRQKAIDMLRGEDFLVRVAEEGMTYDERREAVYNVKKDEDALCRIALENSDYLICKLATKYLTDQSLLSKVALGDGHWEVRREAMEKLKDQHLLEQIAMQDNDKSVRYAALGAITDESILRRISKEAPDATTRRNANSWLVRLWNSSKK